MSIQSKDYRKALVMIFKGDNVNKFLDDLGCRKFQPAVGDEIDEWEQEHLAPPPEQIDSDSLLVYVSTEQDNKPIWVQVAGAASSEDETYKIVTSQEDPREQTVPLAQLRSISADDVDVPKAKAFVAKVRLIMFSLLFFFR